MQAVSSRDVLIITAAAAAGASLTATLWARRSRRPHNDTGVSARDQVEELHRAYRDRAAPPAGLATPALHHALEPTAPAARRPSA
jgi:hypothetical protein